MMNARWIAVLMLGAVLANASGEPKEPGTAGQQAGSAGEASPSTQPSGAPGREPSATPRREHTLDLGNGVTLKLVEIPAGKFLMGSKFSAEEVARRYGGEAGWYQNEHPRHEVTISKPFYMGVTPVTVDQFAAFVKDSGYRTDAEKFGWSFGVEIKNGEANFPRVDGCSWRNPGFDQKGDHPVVHVSWNDAGAFCEWLSKKSGKTVALPTEAQWEYACRAGTTTAFPWGDDPDDGKGWANAADQSLKKKLPKRECFSWDDGFLFTSPVGHFKANAFGLYDMIGNVFEWCQDRFGDYDKGPVTDPTGVDTGGLRVLRGGCWIIHPMYCRSAGRSLRLRRVPGHRLIDVGFRVVAVLAGVD
ncbi:MAG: formylglycine-generating enzyme family protein [Phycisphaerales bacterium]|nr:formylglycine-generating enzyme family protein [Phycisphaerales bacterium]